MKRKTAIIVLCGSLLSGLLPAEEQGDNPDEFRLIRNVGGRIYITDLSRKKIVEAGGGFGENGHAPKSDLALALRKGIAAMARKTPAWEKYYRVHSVARELCEVGIFYRVEFAPLQAKNVEEANLIPLYILYDGTVSVTAAIN